MDDIVAYLGQYGTTLALLVFLTAVSFTIPPVIEWIDRLKKRRRARV